MGGGGGGATGLDPEWTMSQLNAPNYSASTTFQTIFIYLISQGPRNYYFPKNSQM